LRGWTGIVLIKMTRLLITSIIPLLALAVGGTSFSQPAGPMEDPIVIQIVQLDHAVAEDLVRVLQPFLSKNGRISAYGPGNKLIIKDRKSIVRELVKVIKGLPVKSPSNHHPTE